MKLPKTIKAIAFSAGVAALAGCGMGSQQMHDQMAQMQESMNEMMRTMNTIDYNASKAKEMATENKMKMNQMMMMGDGRKMMMKDKMMMRKMMK